MLMRSSIHKNIFFSVFAVLSFMIGAVFMGLFSAHAASSTCYDITGVVATDFGLISFDHIDGGPDFAHEACVEDEGPTPGDGPFTVKGWAFSNEFGWVSMYCADENSDGPLFENFGIPCGNFVYGTIMDGSAGANPGRLSGFAWGDNPQLQLISFNCANSETCFPPIGGVNYWVEAETAETACWGKVFSSSPPPPCESPNLNESVLAWSDSAGWMDFTGVIFPWTELTSFPVDVEFEILPNPADVNKLNAPVADGADGYMMKLHLTQDGLPIDPALYEIMVETEWENLVNLNQTDGVVRVDCAADPSNPACAVTNPSSLISAPPLSPDLGGWTDYGLGAGDPDAYSFNVTSFAPTSAMNGYDDGDDGSVDFSYEQFVLGGPGFPLPPNTLVLKAVKVSVKQIAGGFCAFGDSGCGPKSILGVAQNMEFNPAVEVDTLSDDKYGDSIAAANGTANSLSYTTACRGIYSDNNCPLKSITINAGVESPFDFVYTNPVDDTVNCDDLEVWFLPFVGPAILFTPVPESSNGVCLETAPPTGDGAYVYTTVSYLNNGKSVSYFSNKLPRVTGTLVYNPVAAISGNVYSTGVTNPQTGQEVRSLGDVSTNVLRNTLLQNMRNIAAGADVVVGAASITAWETPNTGFVVNNGKVAKLLPDIAGIPKVYYFKGDMTIETNIVDLGWNGERTIIVDGGDLFIDRNLYNAQPSFEKLGIIVLKNLVTGAGGNIYVAPNVTNIQANMYADGSFFSYDGNPANINANGEPLFGSEAQRFDSLKNQLKIDGSLASQNTIGGAAKNPPILGDGTEVSGIEGVYSPSATGKSRARLYDLNFLRYYGLVFERKDSFTPCPGDAVDQQNPGLCPDYGWPYDLQPASFEAYPAYGDLVPIAGGQTAKGLTSLDESAVYIEFNPPSATLPAFGTGMGVDIRIRP